jgi:hypothetical protein
LLVGLWPLAPALQAEEWTSAAHNCAITLPADDHWEVSKQSAVPESNVQGMPAYEAVGVRNEGDRTAYNFTHVIMAGG